MKIRSTGICRLPHCEDASLVGRAARVQAISNGARVGVTIESLEKVALISESLPEVSLEKISDGLKEQRALERRVQESMGLLGQPVPLLLTTDFGHDR